MRKSILVHLTLVTASTIALGQSPVSQAGSMAADEPTRESVWNSNLGSDPLGAGDLIYVSVAGAPEMSRSFRLDAEGSIALPIGGAKIVLQGLTPDQCAAIVKEKLQSTRILVDPIVSVSVLDYRSRQVTVVGAVKQPGMVQAVGEFRVLDAIAKAEGLSPDAGPNVIVTRNVNGRQSQTTIPFKEILAGGKPDQDILLRGGDEVRVPEASKIYIVGNIKTPGIYPLSESNGTTVLKALAMSQGQLSFTTKKAYIYRNTDGKREEIKVPLREILHRSAPDMALLANDILYIPESSGLHLTASVLDRMANFGGSVGSGLIIWH